MKKVISFLLMLLIAVNTLPFKAKAFQGIEYCKKRYGTDVVSECVANLRKQNIFFVDPVSSKKAGECEVVDMGPKDIYMLGDSITARSTEALKSEFAKTGNSVTKINADEGRALSKDTSGEPRAPSGIEAVKQDAEIIKKSNTIIVALGTNSGGENLSKQIPILISEIKAINSTASIFWVNTFFTTNIEQKNQFNTVIANLSKAPQGYNVIDLSGYNIPLDDGIHPNAEGVSFFANKVAAATGVTLVEPTSTSQSLSLPAEIDPRWIPVWTAAAAEFGTDAAYIGAIFTSEHGGNFSSYEGDSSGRWARPNGTKVADGTQPAAGPFQFMGTSWDDIVGRMGESWPRSDRDDPVKASRAAAYYIKMVGGVPGLEAGSWEQPQGFKKSRSEKPYTVASVAVRYNQGLAWDDSRSVQGNNNVKWYANNAAEKFELLKGKLGSAAGTINGCNSQKSAGANGWDLPGEGDHPMVYYSQMRTGNDPAVKGYFGASPYGSKTISECGCGPTSFAMIVSTLTGKETTPAEVAEWASGNGWQQPTCGSNWWWTAGRESEEKWGVRARRIQLEDASGELRKGNLIIVSAGPGSILLSPGGNGHLLVMRAVTDDGRYLFADPSDSPSKRNAYSLIKTSGSSRTPLDAATVANGLKALFVVEKIQ